MILYGARIDAPVKGGSARLKLPGPYRSAGIEKRSLKRGGKYEKRRVKP
jgi:hypothetical protein